MTRDCLCIETDPYVRETDPYVREEVMRAMCFTNYHELPRRGGGGGGGGSWKSHMARLTSSLTPPPPVQLGVVAFPLTYSIYYIQVQLGMVAMALTPSSSEFNSRFASFSSPTRHSAADLVCLTPLTVV